MDLRTHRLLLRRLQADDAPWIAREVANPKVQRWLTAPPHPYRASDAEWFVNEHAQDPNFRVIADASAPQGIVSLTRANGGPPDLGYWLAERVWGRGYMTEAVRALLDWHFSVGGVDVASGWITGNAPSRHLLLKLGFAPDGVKTDRCHFRDEDVTIERVRLTAARWRTLSAPH